MRQVDWKVFVMILYPRPRTGEISKLRTLSSEMMNGLTLCTTGRETAARAAIKDKLSLMLHILSIRLFMSESWQWIFRNCGFLGERRFHFCDRKAQFLYRSRVMDTLSLNIALFSIDNALFLARLISSFYVFSPNNMYSTSWEKVQPLRTF